MKMNTGEKIKKVRIEKGITQKELADKLGTSQQNLSQYENGKRNPKFGTLLTIADALNVKFSELIDDEASTAEIIKYFLGPEKITIAKRKLELDMIEIDLINLFRDLNNENKDKAIDYMELLKLRQDQAGPQPQFYMKPVENEESQTGK